MIELCDGAEARPSMCLQLYAFPTHPKREFYPPETPVSSRRRAVARAYGAAESGTGSAECGRFDACGFGVGEASHAEGVEEAEEAGEDRDDEGDLE